MRAGPGTPGAGTSEYLIRPYVEADRQQDCCWVAERVGDGRVVGYLTGTLSRRGEA